MAGKGRPRSFDRDRALDRAMDAFWERGYEGTSIADLLQVMAINPPSLYAAFGSKEQLFRDALARYEQREGRAAAQALAQGPTARESIAAMLHANAQAYAEPDRPSGCMTVLSAVVGTPTNDTVRAFVRALRLRSLEAIRQRIQRGIADGDVDPSTDTAALAMYYSSVLSGMSLLARDGAGVDDLQRVVDCAMAGWLQSPSPGPGRDTSHGEKVRPQDRKARRSAKR